MLDLSYTHYDEELQSLLVQWQQGDSQASDTLFNRMYTELRRLSAALLSREDNVSLSASDLVNEASLRLLNLHSMSFQDKSHFLAFSATVMRQVLIDHCRKKMSQRRFHEKVTLITQCATLDQNPLDFGLLEEALLELEAIDPERVKIVEMRYYGGLSVQEIATVMGVSDSTIKRSWRASRIWLLGAIEAKRLSA